MKFATIFYNSKTPKSFAFDSWILFAPLKSSNISGLSIRESEFRQPYYAFSLSGDYDKQAFFLQQNLLFRFLALFLRSMFSRPIVFRSKLSFFLTYVFVSLWISDLEGQHQCTMYTSSTVAAAKSNNSYLGIFTSKLRNDVTDWLVAN